MSVVITYKNWIVTIYLSEIFSLNLMWRPICLLPLKNVYNIVRYLTVVHMQRRWPRQFNTSTIKLHNQWFSRCTWNIYKKADVILLFLLIFNFIILHKIGRKSMIIENKILNCHRNFRVGIWVLIFPKAKGNLVVPQFYCNIKWKHFQI